MFRLDGRVALVTGASQGIGAETARLLARRGAKVVLAARSTEKLQTLVSEFAAEGLEAHALTLDVSKAAELAERVKEIPAEFQPVQILVNNAGITADNLLARMSLEQWQQVIDTNLTGAYALTRALLRGMMRNRWGRIIHIASISGLMGNPGQANYSASKAGLIGFSKAIARELGSRNITSNVVAPGFTETAMTAGLDEAQRRQLQEQVVVGRLGTPQDIAAAVLYLASEEAGYVTGETLNVSGGLYI
jgi:3-oxoacyl-[acyl-carrier protein] reductase